MIVDVSAKFAIGPAGRMARSSAISSASLNAGDEAFIAASPGVGRIDSGMANVGERGEAAHGSRKPSLVTRQHAPSPNSGLQRPHVERGAALPGGDRTGRLMGALESQLGAEGVGSENRRAAAAALAGNVVQESRINPSAVHDDGTGYGIYGARNERRSRMFGWLAANKYPRNSLEGQARYMAHEAMTRPEYSETRRALSGASHENVGAVANTIMWNFERPKHHDTNRARNASSILRDLKQK